jgi:hypothetical protein
MLHREAVVVELLQGAYPWELGRAYSCETMTTVTVIAC